jgi:hypothetical protein
VGQSLWSASAFRGLQLCVDFFVVLAHFQLSEDHPSALQTSSPHPRLEQVGSF